MAVKMLIMGWEKRVWIPMMIMMMTFMLGNEYLITMMIVIISWFSCMGHGSWMGWEERMMIFMLEKRISIPMMPGQPRCQYQWVSAYLIGHEIKSYFFSTQVDLHEQSHHHQASLKQISSFVIILPIVSIIILTITCTNINDEQKSKRQKCHCVQAAIYLVEQGIVWFELYRIVYCYYGILWYCTQLHGIV